MIVHDVDRAPPVREKPRPSTGGESELARRANSGPHASSLAALGPVVAQRAARSGGGLPDGLRAGLERLSGRDLSGVRVHLNSPEPAQLEAHAFAQGRDIHVAPGQERHLPHEGWHAVQQMEGRVRPTAALGRTPLNDDRALEREADVMGRRAMHAGSAVQRAALRAGGAGAPSAVVQRIEFGSEAEAIEALDAILRSDVDEAEQLRIAKEYLDYAQERGWDALEDLAIRFVRRVEDEETERVMTRRDPDAPLREEAARLAPLLDAGDRDPALVVAALKGLGPVADDAAAARAVTASIALFRRIRSILERGILRPTDLKADNVDFTPSSDLTTEDRVSFFDVDQDRPGVEEERFPFPGHQSIGPVLERRNDTFSNVRNLFAAARAGKGKAIDRLREFRGSFEQFFKPDETLDSTEGIERFTSSDAWDRRFLGRSLVSFLGAMIVRQPEFVPVLERRAARSALFVSSGDRLENSAVAGDRATGGARVQELRAARSLEPEAITHVLVPEHMRGFVPLLRGMADGVTVQAVATTAEPVQVGYYDHASSTSTTVNIRVPDYQSAIETLMATHRKLLTHITNIP